MVRSGLSTLILREKLVASALVVPMVVGMLSPLRWRVWELEGLILGMSGIGGGALRGEGGMACTCREERRGGKALAFCVASMAILASLSFSEEVDVRSGAC